MTKNIGPFLICGCASLFLCAAAAQEPAMRGGERPIFAPSGVPAAKTLPPRDAAPSLLAGSEASPVREVADPDAGPLLDLGPRPTRIFFDSEYLLLRPRRRSMDLAIAAPQNDGTPQGAIETLNWQTESGFRFGGGLRPSNQDWDVGAFYTYLHSSNGRSIDDSAGGILLPTQTHPFRVTAADTATGTTSLRYDSVDLEIGRRFEPAKDLTLRLVGGGKFTWMNQCFDVAYNGQNAVGSQYSAPLDFSGVGLRIGADGEWRLRGNFSVFARAYGSMLLGNFRSRVRETNNNGQFILADVTDNFQDVVPVLEMSIGAAYAWRNVKLQLGYQMIDYFNVVNGLRFVDDVAIGRFERQTGNVSLDGLMLQFMIDF